MASKTHRRSIKQALAVALTFALAVVSVGSSEARVIGGRHALRVLASGADSAHGAGTIRLKFLAGEPLADSLFGRSGKLRARFIGAQRGAFAIPLVERLFGDSAIDRPGVYAVRDSLPAVRDSLPTDSVVAESWSPSPSFAFISLLPFREKSGGWLRGYHIGFWPAERGRPLRNESYANPDGFIVVTPENQDTQLSEHFRLRDFITHDQGDVWPKYLVLHEDLIDKLELVISTLQSEGIPVRHLAVMSGFRTPQYNAHGGETGGRSRISRHMYGDAADVFVDNNGDGRMDDLNHDGRVDYRDARVIQRAVEIVEHRYPDLIGGVGVYRGTRSHGPFAHVDVRGWRARWGRVG